MRRLRNFAALAILLPVSACGGGGEGTYYAPGTTAHHPASRAPQQRQQAVSDTAFVANNGSFDLFVIRASELAAQRSSSQRVRDLAQTFIADHKGTSGQLSLEGRRLNLLPSATLQAREQAMLDGLQTSGNFDADYVRDMRNVHQQAVAMDSAYKTRGRSPTLRAVAASALPIEQRHLRLLG